jgi:outer membrane protein TolC
MRLLSCFLFLVCAVWGEVRMLTLRQTIDTALAQNPELVLARVEERRAGAAARAARDPFVPRVFAGSGLAYSSGFPLSIEGSAPSIVESRAIASLFNKPQQYMLQKARQDARTAIVASEMKKEDIAFQAAVLYLEAGRLASALRAAREQLTNLTAVEEAVKARVNEGRELPMEARRATLRLAQARQRAQRLEVSRNDAESQLAVILNLPDGDLARPAEPEVPVLIGLQEEASAVAEALRNSKEIRRLQSALQAKALEQRSYASARLPRVDLVAQYGLFAKYNNYERFFNRFQRHNWQAGASIQIPLTPSLAAKAQKEGAEAEIFGLRAQVNAARLKTSSQARRAWQEIAASQSAADLAKLDLEVAREQTGLLLTLYEEGRATQRQLEEARFVENEKWMALFDAGYALDRARLELLRATGMLIAALRN